MIDANALRSRLDAHDHRRILKRCGFELNGQSGPKLSGVLGPNALGEGESGNFSVDLERGFVKDWGSSGYEGDVFDVVKDVHGLNFPSALEWVVDELNLDVASDGRSNEQSTGASSPESNRPPNNQSEPEPAASHEQVRRWHERLMSDTDAAHAARSYLMGERGLHPGVVKMSHVGLAHENEIPDDWGGFHRTEARSVTWWVIFPVARRDLDGAPVVSVKGVAFNPSRCDWARNEDGEKIPSNVSSALWDLVPTEDDGTPRIDGPVVACEGELDALCALSHGFNAVTGTAGAGTFKPAWGSYLSSLAPAQAHGVVVAFDGDETGREGAQGAATLLHEAGVDVRVASLPDGRDVNDVLVEGDRADLDALLAQAEPFGPEAPGQEPTQKNGGRVRPVRDTKQEEDDSCDYESFPIDVLPGPVQAYVHASTRALGEEVPPAMVAVPTLSVLSGAIGDAARLQLKRSWTEPATLWTVLVAPSGSTKSPAFSHAVRPVFRRESEARDEHEKALSEWKAREDPDPQDKPTRKRFRTGDVTPEAVVKILEENPRGVLLARDELGAWIGSFDRYVNGAADLQFWVEVWQGVQASRDRAGEDNTTVDTPAVPITGTIQPGTLKEKLDELHFDTGFAARLILCQPPTAPKRWTEADVSREVRDAYKRVLTRLYGTPRDSTVSLSPEAKRLWVDYYNEANAKLETRPEGPAKAVAAKGITHTARLALVLHLCRTASGDTDSHEVDAASMEAALQVGRWLTAETLRVYRKHNLGTKAQPPIRRFLEALPERFETSDAKEVAEANDIARRTLFKWLDDLQESGALEKIKRGLYRKT
jgi:hypothetical protein